MLTEIKESKKKQLVESIRCFEKTPLAFFIRRKKLTYLIIVFLLLVGIIQIKNLPRELQPEVKIPIGIVVTSYPGASPLDVEEQITKKIETKLSDLADKKEITSNSGFGLSTVTVEFEAGSDLDDSIRKLKDKVDEAKNDLPVDASSPAVIEIKSNDYPVLGFSLGGINYDKAELKELGERIKMELEGIPNVREVKVIGGEEKEFLIEIQPDKLSAFGFSINDIIATINVNNLNLPLGSVAINELNYGIRVENEIKSAEEIGNLIVGNKEGREIRIGDLALVRETYKEKETISRISVAGESAKDTVSIQIFKRMGGNITQVAKEAKKLVEEEKGKLYPADVDVVVTTDTAKYIEKSINDLTQNGLGTVVIILILLILFLGIREAFIASISVPFSFFIAFMVMAFLDQSLNFITLFSLVLALGILVDSAVVIVEGMYEKITKYKMSGYGAAICSIKEYAAPLLSGMLTTVAAFLPLLFVKGIFGEFMQGIPIVVIATLVAALFVSLSIIPAIGSVFLKPASEKFGKSFVGRITDFFKRIFQFLLEKYDKYLRKIIESRKRRRIVIGGVWLLFVISLGLPLGGFLKFQVFGETDAEEIWIDFELPEGTTLDKTDETVKKIEERLYSIDEIKNFVTAIGSSLSFEIGLGATGSNVGTIALNLVEKENREKTSVEIEEEIRIALREITDGEIEVIGQQGGPPTGAALEVKLKGEDLNELDRISQDIQKIMESIPGTEDVKTSIKYLPGEFLVNFNPDILNVFHLTPIQVAGELRKGISGDDKAKILREGDELKIRVKYSSKEINDLNDLSGIMISNNQGQSVALGELADLEISPSISSITRVGQERTIIITGRNIQGTNANEIMNEFKKQVKDYDLPVGYFLSYGGITQEQNEVYWDMFFKMIIGIILILFILVAQFNSYRQVIIILVTIPLAMIGVIWGMTLAGLILDIPAFVGIVSLSGIVVNNAIILIDSINRRKKETKGKDLIESVIRASHSRLRPIMLTTVTTILGLLPLSLREPDWRNMGFTIIFGLTFSSILTLFVVPSLYVSFSRIKKQPVKIAGD